MKIDPYSTPFDDLNPVYYKHEKLLYRSIVIYYHAKRFLIKNKIKCSEFSTWQEQKPRAEFIRELIGSIIDEYEHSIDAEASDNYRLLKPEIENAKRKLHNFQESLNCYSANLIGRLRKLENSTNDKSNILEEVEKNILNLRELLCTLLQGSDVGGRQVSFSRDNLIKNTVLLYYTFTEEIPKKNFKKAKGKMLSSGIFEELFISPELNFIRMISSFVDPDITDSNIVSTLRKMDFSRLSANTPDEN